MRHLADGVVKAGKIAVADFVCSQLKQEKIFDADFTVWMDTILKKVKMKIQIPYLNC